MSETEIIPDGNKSDLTRKATAAATLYLSERGFKPIESEVPIARQWVADLAGVCDPTRTELVKMKLVGHRPKWRSEDRGAKVEIWETGLAPFLRVLTALVEVKTTRADFCGDPKWNRKPISDLAYLVVPAQMVRPDEWPEGWGVLEYRLAPDVCRLARVPTCRLADVESQRDIIHAIAIHRDHHTRYARLRTFKQQAQAALSEERGVSRLCNLSRAMLSIADGKHESVENALSYHGIRKFPSWLIPELQKLWNVRHA